ncbi:hypothetical protein EGW08_001687, partial [Elysia chlorotica]
QYACSRVNGNLLEIDSLQELDLVRRAIEPLLMDAIEIHIGGKFEQATGAISSQVVTGRQLFSEWHTGHPVAQGSELCVTLYKRSRDRGVKMGSILCNENPRRFICEI